MQTFLPYPSVVLSAHVLDARRLGKQRVEAVQILRTIARGAMNGWAVHPAVGMWRGHEAYLALYCHYCIQEWVARGYNNTMPSPRTVEGARHWYLPEDWAQQTPVPPDWLGYTRLHASHRAALLAKDPDWYAQFCWDETPVIDYFWPGKMPAPGDLVTDGVTVAVVRRVGMEVIDCEIQGDSPSDTHQMQLSRRDVWTRKWQKAVRI